MRMGLGRDVYLARGLPGALHGHPAALLSPLTNLFLALLADLVLACCARIHSYGGD